MEVADPAEMKRRVRRYTQDYARSEVIKIEISRITSRYTKATNLIILATAAIVAYMKGFASTDFFTFHWKSAPLAAIPLLFYYIFSKATLRFLKSTPWLPFSTSITVLLSSAALTAATSIITLAALGFQPKLLLGNGNTLTEFQKSAAFGQLLSLDLALIWILIVVSFLIKEFLELGRATRRFPIQIAVTHLLQATVTSRDMSKSRIYEKVPELTYNLTQAAWSLRIGLGAQLAKQAINSTEHLAIRNRFNQIAKVLESYRIQAILPANDTFAELSQHLAQFTITMIRQDYDELPTADDVDRRSSRLSAGRSIVIGLIPISIVLISKSLGFRVPEPYDGPLVTGAIIWVAINLVFAADPLIKERVSLAKDVMQFWRSSKE